MPTFTRLLALLLFSAAAFVLSELFQRLDEEIPPSLSRSLWLAAVAAPVGWAFVGPRIGRSFMRGLSVVIQGYIAVFLLGLLLSGAVDALRGSYRMRHQTFTDVFTALFTDMQTHLAQMADPDFLILVSGSVCAIAILLVAGFRISEARRLAQ